MRGTSFFAPLWHRRHGGADALLALLVLAVVALMVLPLPTWLIDVLLASSLAGSIAILLLTLYARTALELTTFPSVILITTLLRVSLNVATTRLILLQADAGVVIRAFGEFAVRGNFAVGAVVFLILTIVQYVVVTKGSERVAEVSARFCLDALPGKQLAIEAELRAGILQPEDARKRQRALERESHFYGAMDGAAKFVKGDAIASLLIALVNLTGGMAVGIGQRHMTVTGALSTYGVLTIGDGLITQIPALLIATAAGILVTRVSGDRQAALGTELSSQLLGIPRALAVAGGVVILLALLPGLPAAPFALIGLALLGAAWTRWGPRGATQDLHTASAFEPPLAPWSLDLGTDLGRAVPGHVLARVEDRLRRHLLLTRGVLLPECRVRIDESLPERRAVLSVREIPSTVLVVPPDVEGPAIADHLHAAIVPWLLARAADFLGIAETKLLVDRLSQSNPTTASQVVPKIVDLALLSDVLRRLLEESVSIRDLKSILEAIARCPAGEKDPHLLTEHVRAELRRALTWELTGGAEELPVVVLDPIIEETVRDAVSRTPAGSLLALAPAAARDIVSAVRRALLDEPGRTGPSVVLTRPDVRRFVRKILETDLPEVRVVSHAELLPDLAVRTVARASLAGL